MPEHPRHIPSPPPSSNFAAAAPAVRADPLSALLYRKRARVAELERELEQLDDEVAAIVRAQEATRALESLGSFITPREHEPER